MWNNKTSEFTLVFGNNDDDDDDDNTCNMAFFEPVTFRLPVPLEIRKIRPLLTDNCLEINSTSYNLLSYNTSKNVTPSIDTCSWAKALKIRLFCRSDPSVDTQLEDRPIEVRVRTLIF